MKTIEAFTDGACRGNPGPGGWGAVLRYNGKEKLLKGAVAETTNNKMELSAAIAALANLKEPCHVILTTDSTYVRDGITKWIHNWKKNGWRSANRKPVKNIELWQQLEKESQRHEIEWHWIKGHSGHRENEMADELANAAIDELLETRS